MDEASIRVERAQNLWGSFARKMEPLSRGATLTAAPELDFDSIGGLAGPKDEIQTYACAATSPKVYADWGTFPPTGILMIGQHGAGKSLLAEALATRTQTSFLRVDVPRMVLDVMHAGGKVGEMIAGWTQVLEELPPLTVYFDELEFSQADEIGVRRADLPVGPIMDFLLEMIDRTIHAENHLVVATTSHPDQLRPAFVRPGRFERVVEVSPIHPDDVVEALQVHARGAEKRAGHALFDTVDWSRLIGRAKDASTGEWVRILHAVLRAKARREASGEEPPPVSTTDLEREVERFNQAQQRIHKPGSGNYV